MTPLMRLLTNSKIKYIWVVVLKKYEQVVINFSFHS